MTTAADTLALLDWKRRVFGLYAAIRELPPESGWELWRDTRDELFRSHPQSPLPPDRRASFAGLDYWPYDPEARVLAELEDVEAPPQGVATSGAEVRSGAGQAAASATGRAPSSLRPQEIVFRPFARASFELGGEPLTLEVSWLAAYGGGAFLSFRDATSGKESYGGGRYLLDTVKGADLGEDGGRLVLDFNFAYNPSCSYDPGWVCPLAPPANRLSVAVEAGEQHLHE
ncbi:MAG TPA: DUF1684 domain-containing protein [Gaiellaceae bacterium]|nr:DUF1684 domain-containing protein [Gaiellaceae bacterium]